MNSSVVPGEKHFTVSAFLITKELPKRVLLLHHKKLNSWMQVGGHVEGMENPVEAVVRETREETGVDISFLLKEIHDIDSEATALPVPKFFLEERIPAYKDQPEHFHLDMFYVLEVPYQEIRLNKAESNELGWFTLDDALRLSIFENTQVLLKEILA